MKPALIVAGALLALPAPALAAPSLAPLKACYVSDWDDQFGNVGEMVQLRGSGFTPGAEIPLMLDGNAAGRATADAAGNVAADVRSPLQEKGEREFTLTATDPSQGAVSTTARVTALDVRVTPRKARPTQKVTISGRGFTGRGAAYAHYVRSGRDRKTVRLAAPRGPCGTFKVRRKQFPMKRPADGLWILRIDQDRRYRSQAKTAFFELEVFVRRVLRSGR